MRKNLQAFSLRDGEASLGLQKRRFHRLRAEGLLDDVRGSGQRGIHIAPGKRRGIEQIRMHVQIAGSMHLGRAGLHRGEWVRHRGVNFVIDFDLARGLARVEGRIGYHQSENIADAASGFADGDKDRQVWNRETGAPLPGNIGRGEDPFHARHRLRLRSINRYHFCARMRAQQRSRVQHSRDAHVIHERLLA